METNLEELAEGAEHWIKANRRALFVVGSLVFTVWLLSLIKEIAVLLAASYLIAVFVNPLVRRLSRRPLGRTGAILFLMISAILLIFIIFFVIFPPVLSQYGDLITQLPSYAETIGRKLQAFAEARGFGNGFNFENLVAWMRTKMTSLKPEYLGQAASSLLGFLLQGYSLTLTILNLALLPFFVFYLSADLERLHGAIASCFNVTTREKLQQLADDILVQVYAFFKGQITVSAIMAILYAIGLWAVGVPSGLAIGFLAGILNVVPYLGVITGLFLSMTSMLIADATWVNAFLVLGVFGSVQFLEGTFLTPKIIGSNTGMHPLGVMLALLIGGQLLGLFGLVIAIPAAAATIVLFRFLWKEVRESEPLI